MRGGKLISSISVLTALVLVVAFAVVAADNKAPDVIDISSPKVWPNPTKKNLPFSHKKHSEEYKVTCVDCHHDYKDGKNIWKEGDPVQKCEACHTDATIKDVNKLPPEQQKLNLNLAFHNNCRGCHQKIKKENKDSLIPVACTGCHAAEKK
jgi:cytochrome c553